MGSEMCIRDSYNILDKLGMEKAEFIFFGRLDLEGMPVSKSELKPLIENGKIPWYDDPRLPTLEGLRRRGIRPEAVRKFIISLGLTKNDTNSPFATLEAFNKKIVDSESVRLHMVSNPKKMKISNFEPKEITLSNHPTKDLGKRTVMVDGILLISGSDVAEMKVGENIRLLGLGVVKINDLANEINAELIDDSENAEKKIQWVAGNDALQIKAIIPDLLFIDEKFNKDSLLTQEVITESAYSNLKDDAEIQFVRLGYYRKESSHQAIFSHK